MEYKINLNEDFSYSFIHPGQSIDKEEFIISYNKNKSIVSKKLLNKTNNSLDKYIITRQDILLGSIIILKDNFALIESDKILGKGLHSEVFFLPIAQIKDTYVKDIKTQLKEKDFILFRIKDENKCTIKQELLGVILTNCTRCNTQIEEIEDNKGICTNCGLINYRKYSIKYGFTNI